MTVIAVNTLSESRARSVDSAVRQEILEAATKANSYYTKHEMMGGGGQSFLNITLNDITLDSVNENAAYEITNRNVESFQITAVPNGGTQTFIANITAGDIIWQ